MSQTVRFTKVNDVLYNEVFTSFPDEAYAVSLILDMLEDGEVELGNDFEVVTEWYEIGSGESGTDYLVPDDKLLEWYSWDCLSDKIKELGFELEMVSSETIRIDGSVVEEEIE